MNSRNRILGLVCLGAAVLAGGTATFAQVSPEEIRDPKLKALEEAHFSQMAALRGKIQAMKFPLPFVLSRYVGLDPKDQAGTDTRGIEFVRFHDRAVLKVTGNYNAAFNATVLTRNQRANQLLDEVVVPLLGAVTEAIPPGANFDAYGFEISYHVRKRTRNYDYEGKEILTLVLDKADAVEYLKAPRESLRQEILDRSEVYVDGQDFGLARGEREAFPLSDSQKASRHQPAPAPETPTASTPPAPPANRVPGVHPDLPGGFHPPAATPTPDPRSPERDILTGAAATKADADALQDKLQAQLQGLDQEGRQRFHFVDYAPPSLDIFRERIYLQLTLRNPGLYDRNATSIYKRAAQSFDLFLAPMLKALLEKVPNEPRLAGLDITVLNEFSPQAAASSEAVEYVCPLVLLKKFADADITNQELLNQSVVLVNGVRISLNLQQVE